MNGLSSRALRVLAWVLLVGAILCSGFVLLNNIERWIADDFKNNISSQGFSFAGASGLIAIAIISTGVLAWLLLLRQAHKEERSRSVS
jgi:hypothetical protein